MNLDVRPPLRAMVGTQVRGAELEWTCRGRRKGGEEIESVQWPMQLRPMKGAARLFPLPETLESGFGLEPTPGPDSILASDEEGVTEEFCLHRFEYLPRRKSNQWQVSPMNMCGSDSAM